VSQAQNLNEEDEKICISIKLWLINGRNFLYGMKHQHLCYSLIPKVDKEGSGEFLLEVSCLLNEFTYIVYDNFPEGLLPVRKRNHQMDSVLATSFPNKGSHRMTPTKIGELNRQVHELLRKGLILESSSPCVVTLVLA